MFHSFFDRLQYCMAEILFRPVVALRSVWYCPRETRRSYRIGCLLLMGADIGFGYLMLLVLSGSVSTMAASVATLLVLLWSLFTIYILVILLVMEVMCLIRRW